MNPIGKELRMFRGAFANVLADESYTIPIQRRLSAVYC